MNEPVGSIAGPNLIPDEVDQAEQEKDKSDQFALGLEDSRTGLFHRCGKNRAGKSGKLEDDSFPDWLRKSEPGGNISHSL